MVPLAAFLALIAIAIAGTAICVTLRSSRFLGKELSPFYSGWYERVGVPLLKYRRDFDRLPTSESGLQVLVTPNEEPDERLRWNGPYLSDPGVVLSDIEDLDGTNLGYVCEEERFRIHSRGHDRRINTDDDFIVHGLYRDSTIIFRVTRGPISIYQSSRGPLERTFFDTLDQELLPALEAYYADVGCYPSINDWRNLALRDYLDAEIAMRAVRGPFHKPLAYHPLADGDGFVIYAAGPEDLLHVEGDLAVVHLRPRSPM